MIYALGYSLCIRDGVQFFVKLPGLEEKGADSSWQIDGPPFLDEIGKTREKIDFKVQNNTFKSKIRL